MPIDDGTPDRKKITGDFICLNPECDLCGKIVQYEVSAGDTITVCKHCREIVQKV